MKIYNKMRFLVFLSCLLFLLVLSCSKEDSVKQEVQFANLDFDYNDNGLEEEFNNDIAKLGRVLFYDKKLSLNSTVSCGSCHKQEFGFADNVAKSEGFLNGLTNRNTPNLINAKFNTMFFWDGRTFSFTDAVTQPIFDEKEMGMTPETLIDRLSELGYYNKLFTDAFGSDKITGLRIQLALVEFVSSILSADAEIDAVIDGSKRLSGSAREGMFLFELHCNSCHNVLATSGNSSGSNVPYYGPSATRNRVDIGLSLQDSLSSTIPNFFFLFDSSSSNQFTRIPTLRNITSTAPYMHDGRFQTLLEVIDHYNEEVIDRPTIDPRLLGQGGKPLKLDLTDEEKDHLISFLKTLSDSSIENLEKHSNPFK